jgi:hypothetical protein
MKVIIKDYAIIKVIYNCAENMPGGWNMDMPLCCGKLTNASLYSQRLNTYRVDSNEWVWHKDALIFLEESDESSC